MADAGTERGGYLGEGLSVEIQASQLAGLEAQQTAGNHLSDWRSRRIAS